MKSRRSQWKKLFKLPLTRLNTRNFTKFLGNVSRSAASLKLLRATAADLLASVKQEYSTVKPQSSGNVKNTTLTCNMHQRHFCKSRC